MEFPDLGKHCSNSFCSKLDFLPMQCDACDKIFCNEHIRYDDHSCSSAYKKDVQVPVCPLCAKPIPVPRGEAPDLKVGEHIDRDCQSDPAKEKRKAYANRCSAPRCKQRELMPVTCSNCRLNFCLRHRHPQDHDCKGYQGTGRSVSNAGAAASQRYSKVNSSKPKTSRPQQTYLHNVGRDLDRERRKRQENIQRAQSNMTEDEALARALQLSVQESEIPESEMTQEQKDMKLAAQLQREEEEAVRGRNQARSSSKSSDSSCRLS